MLTYHPSLLFSPHLHPSFQPRADTLQIPDKCALAG